uniref:Strawberry notch homolog 1 n=1 Tax=Syphacia muris TaxID=451379 RepID=A0A158R3X8_9BILA
LTHSSVHYETGHQYLPTAPRQTTYVSQRTVHDTSEYAPAVRHITRIASAQSLGSRRFSFDSSGKQVAANVWNCELKTGSLVKPDDPLNRRVKVFVEQEDDSKLNNLRRNQKVENLEVKNDFVPNFVAKYEEVGGTEEMVAVNVDGKVENLGYAETYADYRPAKLRSGLAHPDCVVETASLSSVTPPDIYYNLTIPEELIDTGGISAVQLEAVLYACQAHETKLPNGERTGYLIGDGAGVGKGRSVACIIFENYLLGRKRSIWLSVSSDLKFDAERDLRDIGASRIKVHALNKFKYAKISGKENGNVKKGCIFATYSSLIGECRSARSKYRTRLKQLIQWCGKDFDGVIVLDECHRAKNLVPSSGSKPTKTGRMVLELQKALPNARIVYASATGATEPRNMAYMVRLGLWGEGQAFPKFDNFINAVERHGVGAMEIVAMDMKQRGLYLARQLSFRGVTFRVEEVPLSPSFIEVYDDAVKLWLECRRQFQVFLMSAYVAKEYSQSRYGANFGYILYLMNYAVKTNKCVVIGLQSTGEARTLEVLDDFGGELTDFVSTDAWLKRLMDEVKSSDEESSDDAESQNDTDTEDERRDDKAPDETDDDVNPFACDFSRGDAFISSSHIIDEEFNEDLLSGGSIVKAELLAAAERLGARLPPNTLDQLINELGGPEYVAEMTGRKGRVVSREDGEIEYELRHAGADVPLELMNMDEKEKFMRGEKLIAVISEAASSGISLQSDRRAPNRRRRVHITLELPWSADKAIQQFGRTHRSNQVSAPEYIFLISELAGEKRFASIVAKRLESLGALTHGDRRATESRDLSQFNLDNRYGRSALDVLLKSVIGYYNPPMIPPPADYKPGNFMADMARYLEGVGILTNENGNYIVEKDSATIAKFLNRILGLPVHAQNALFQYFADIVAELVRQAKHDGSYDMGIMDLGMGGDEARKLETRVFLGRVERGSYRVEIHKIGVERGVSWEDAYAIWKDHHEDEDGFYVSNVGVNGKKAAILVYGIGKKMLDTGARLYCVTRPSTGRSAKLETLAELSKRFRSASPEETKDIWKQQYEGSRIMCQHKYFHGRCKSEAKGVYCETGRRTRTYFVLSGSVLSVWPVVEESLSKQRMQIIRIRTEEDLKIVGLLILPQYVRTLVIRLEEHCGSSFVEQKESSVL